MAELKLVSVLALCLVTSLASAAQSTLSRSAEDKIHARYYDSDVETVYEKALDAVFMLDWKVKSKNPKAGVIIVKTARNMHSFGDKVRILIFPTKDGRVRIDMTSKSGSLIARNKKNIREFYQYLDGVMGVLQ
jgi:hypothetical protein